MENRFTIKDAFLFALLVMCIVMVGLGMKQFDRQYEMVLEIERQANLTARDVQAMSERLDSLDIRLEQGVVSTGRGTGATTGAAPSDPANDPFAALREARSRPDFRQGDWLIDNVGTRVGRLTPLIQEDIYNATIRGRIMETLLIRDPQSLEYRPLLAESYELSADGLELRYKLRKGVRFSDGTPMTADDVVYTFDLIMNPEIDAARARSYLVDQGVTWEKVNDHEVVFRMKKPYFEFLSITGIDTLIMSKAFYSKYTTAQYNELPGLAFGTGPYRLRNPGEWTPGDRIELLRNERYWGVKPAFDRLIFLEVEEEAAEATMFQNRELDVLAATPEQYDQLKNDPKIKENANALEYPSLLGGYTYVGWNQERDGKATFFSDKRVRQAMTMLIDRERMAKEIWRGYATVATGPFSRRGKQAAPELEPWPYDPARAKALLAEAGYADRDGDGILESPAGRAFQFQLLYPSKSDISQRQALFLKDGLARGGVIMELKPTDWPTMLENLKNSNFDATTLGWSSSVEGDLYQIFHSSQIKDSGDNRTAYSNPELDTLIEAARSNPNEAERMKQWQECTRLIHEDQPYTFLLDRLALRLMDKRIANVQRSTTGLNFVGLWSMPMPWYVPGGMHRYRD